MSNFTDEIRREMATRYWAIKRLGTVEGLAAEYGISKPTLIKYAKQFPPAKE